MAQKGKVINFQERMKERRHKAWKEFRALSDDLVDNPKEEEDGK